MKREKRIKSRLQKYKQLHRNTENEYIAAKLKGADKYALKLLETKLIGYASKIEKYEHHRAKLGF